MTVSIITACFNARSTIQRAIESVLSQNYSSIEYIVIDGSSQDGTWEIVQSFVDKIAFAVSEVDQGIGDAWNKGIAKATGELIYLFNADDEIPPDFIAKAVEAYRDFAQPCILFSDTCYIRTASEVRFVVANFRPEKIHQGLGFYHTTAVVHRAVYAQVGLFNVNYKVALDIEFLLRAHNAGVPFFKFNANNYMYGGGVSDRKRSQARKESLKIWKIHGTPRQYREKRRSLSLISRWRRSVLQFSGRTKAFIGYLLLNGVYSRIPSFALRRHLLRRLGIKLGTSSYIHSGCRFFRIGRVVIGNNSVVNRGCYLDNRMGIEIGNNVNISHDTKIYTLGHDYNHPFFLTKGGQVTINDDAVLFSNVLVMPGVTIGRGAVVMAGSVVTKDIPEYMVVGGNPARILRERNHDVRYALNHHSWFSY